MTESSQTISPRKGSPFLSGSSLLTKILLYGELMRLHKPIGAVFLIFPCWWGVAFEQKSHISLKLLALFALGGVIMRSAGCVLNDFFDRDLDRCVIRTAQRPLANGRLSPPHALVLFAILSGAGGGILLCLPSSLWIGGPIGLGLLILYPLMKRWISFPQLWLGLTFNIGFLMGGVAARDDLSFLAQREVWLIYLGSVIWTMMYDTIYALQDRHEDQRYGMGSTAVLWGIHVKKVLGGGYLLAGSLIGIGLGKASFGVIIPLLGAVGYRLWGLDMDNRAACQKLFVDNQWGFVILFLFTMIV